MRRVLGLVIAVLVFHASPARADSRLWFGSLNYESTRLVVPVFVLLATDDEGNEWSVGVTGWTLSAERRITIDSRRKRHLFARITPINAQSGRYVYRDGRRDASAEFNASSVELGGGLEVAHRSRWTGAYRVLAVYTPVQDLDPTLVAYWKRPFAGVEIAHTYARVTAEELFGARWEGVKASGALQVFTGTNTWSRLQVRVGAGKRMGRLRLSGRGAAFTGQSLNTVSAFVIGGSWDLAPPELIAGYRYGEFRLHRAAIAGAALDVRVRGAWDVGVRGSYLRGRAVDEAGAAVQMMTVWKGAVFNAGVAVPRTALARRNTDRIVVFATLSAAILQQ
jgi:hypothetical protein